MLENAFGTVKHGELSFAGLGMSMGNKSTHPVVDEYWPKSWDRLLALPLCLSEPCVSCHLLSVFASFPALRSLDLGTEMHRSPEFGRALGQ